MPTTNPEKNREQVKASNMKKKEQIGEEEYNKYFANNQQQYRDRKKETEEKAELYKKQQAEYMKQYRAKHHILGVGSLVSDHEILVIGAKYLHNTIVGALLLLDSSSFTGLIDLMESITKF